MHSCGQTRPQSGRKAYLAAAGAAVNSSCSGPRAATVRATASFESRYTLTDACRTACGLMRSTSDGAHRVEVDACELAVSCKRSTALLSCPVASTIKRSRKWRLLSLQVHQPTSISGPCSWCCWFAQREFAQAVAGRQLRTFPARCVSVAIDVAAAPMSVYLPSCRAASCSQFDTCACSPTLFSAVSSWEGTQGAAASHRVRRLYVGLAAVHSRLIAQPEGS